MNGGRIKPCISFCERVEQRCPYFRPIMKEQYGGQPLFICRDPNIPFMSEMKPDIPYSEPSECYDLCQLSNDQNELITDSLSKYAHDKCPDKISIAEEVRSDPLYCESDPRQHSTQSNKTIAASSPQDEKYGTSTTTKSSIVGEESKSFNTNEINKLLFNDKLPTNQSEPKLASKIHAHLKKIHELRQVLTIYKSQPKTHRFVHHSGH